MGTLEALIAKKGFPSLWRDFLLPIVVSTAHNETQTAKNSFPFLCKAKKKSRFEYTLILNNLQPKETTFKLQLHIVKIIYSSMHACSCEGIRQKAGWTVMIYSQLQYDQMHAYNIGVQQTYNCGKSARRSTQNTEFGVNTQQNSKMVVWVSIQHCQQCLFNCPLKLA